MHRPGTERGGGGRGRARVRQQAADRLQDAFRARVLFPICDPSGHPVALGGRVLPGSTDPAKYKNSTETPIYSKRKTLYALNWAKQDIIASDEVVVCEGYTDVIGLFGVGVQRAVATCGTALAEEHVKLLRGFASRVVLAFDADGAGQSAAGRFYEWQRKLAIDVAVAALPPGSDPGELARTDPEGLRAAIAGAKPFLQFRVDRILDAAELGTPEGRARAADSRPGRRGRAPGQPGAGPVPHAGGRALPARARPAARPAGAAAAGGSPTRRGSHRVADRPGRRPPRRSAAARTRRRRVPTIPGCGSPRPMASGMPTGSTGEAWSDDGGAVAADGAERTAPGRVQPRSSAPASRPSAWPSTGPRMSADRLEAALFRDDLQRAAFEVLAGADDEPLHEVIERPRPEVRALLVRLTVEEPRSGPDEVVLQLVRDAARGELAVITGEARTSPEAAAEAAAGGILGPGAG